MKKIVLASRSSRRKEILESVGIKFIIDPADDFEESSDYSIDPEEFVKQNASGKARAVAHKHEDAIIIGVDTIGELDGEILEKPKSIAHARKILNFLNGKRHRVISGLSVYDTETKEEVCVAVTTWVTFADMSEYEIERYLESGESMDKAAAFAIQGLGSLFIEKIEGDYFNVVGLPMQRLYEILKTFGVEII